MAKGSGTALVLGGAECVWDDIDRLETLMGGPWPGTVFACNDMAFKEGHNGRRWEAPIHHWCTLHAEKLQGWKVMRKQAGLEPITETWSSVRRTIVKNHFKGLTRGSSGLYTASVALLACHHPRVVLCGIPMDASKNTFSGKDWTSCNRYRRGWQAEHEKLKSRVRSLSGWTARTFGVPTVEWIGLVPPAIEV